MKGLYCLVPGVTLLWPCRHERKAASNGQYVSSHPATIKIEHLRKAFRENFQLNQSEVLPDQVGRQPSDPVNSPAQVIVTLNSGWTFSKVMV